MLWDWPQNLKLLHDVDIAYICKPWILIVIIAQKVLDKILQVQKMILELMFQKSIGDGFTWKIPKSHILQSIPVSNICET